MPSTLVSELLFLTESLINVSQGLFAPRDGQQVRFDQRRNRSQYDRGTLPALMEEDEQDQLYFYCEFPGHNISHSSCANSFDKEVPR